MNEMWIGTHHLIPGHMSLKDWYIYYKYKFNYWWYKHIGKYKFIDTSKGRFISYTQDIFVLSEKQTEQVKGKYYKKYIFIPTNIGNIFKVEDKDGNIVDLTDYNLW